MKKNLLAIIFCVASVSLYSQVGHGGEPTNWSDKHLNDDIPFIVLPSIDRTTLDAQDEITDQFKDVPYRFGVEHTVDITTENSGNWIFDTDLNTATWTLGFECPGALNVSIRFDSFALPAGAQLFIWSADRQEFIGSFTEESNVNGGSFATTLLHGDKVVVELALSLDKVGEHSLQVGQVVHGYRSFLKSRFSPELDAGDRGPFGDSGNCEVNVNCPEGDEWQIEKRSVAIIVEGGYGMCTGALVNNTANDGTPYFLTADHCTSGSNVGNWNFYFNHESATCNGTTAPTNESISGADLLASNAYSDFALLLLDEIPPASYEVQYAGWDATDSEAAVSSAVCIHHPSGDIKKISFEEDAPYHDVGNGAQVWWVDDWELGVTEPGSSGSPLFDQDHRIIGQLFGGASACIGNSGNGAFDFYGRFGQSWDHSASSSAQLEFWLDPEETGVLVLNGFPDGFEAAQLDAAVAEVVNVPLLSCSGNVTPGIILQNNGTAILTSATIHYQYNNGAEQTIDWTGSLSENESTTIWLPALPGVNGNNEIEVSVSDPNGGLDENPGNNATSLSFVIATGDGYATTVELLFDDYPYETSWEIVQDGDLLFEGGPYEDFADGELLQIGFCLAPGCYEFTIFDEYGDGMCCEYGNGSYTVLNQNEVSYGSGGSFADSETVEFCVDATMVNEKDYSAFAIYPNPANNQVVITNTLAATRIEVSDISGRIVQSVSCNADITLISTVGIADGSYIVRIYAEDQVSVEHLIVRH